MSKEKNVPLSRDPRKVNWNLYGLQQLQPDRFARIVKEILDGECLAFRPTTRPQAST